MIEKLLNKFGYSKIVRDLKSNPFTEEEICTMFAEVIGDVHDYSISKKDEVKLFQDLSVIDGWKDYLRATLSKDMQRYFGAGEDKTRDLVKGAAARTSFLLAGLKGTKELKETKLGNLRYEK